MPIKITVNDAAVKVIADRLTENFKKLGDAADSIGRVADNITAATTSPKLRQSQRWLGWVGAASFGVILDRIFGGRRRDNL